MNKNKLKTYAPKAREEFIKAVTERAHFYGISKDTVEACTIKGDFAFIAGRAFPKKLADTHKNLIARIDKSSFTQVMEEVAYTWFNRIAAIRFMEINGYLAHGYRVLSHPDGQAEPEILEKAQFLDKLDGLEKEEILRLKMAADKDKELYQRLLVAQCNELSNAMPFLFEKVDDPTELLLPDNLLNTDSVIRQMVNEIPEEDWKKVEIIGWMYQFYIFEKKDALLKAKKTYKTEDIPAVTQLFTPNWIVKYLVQNSLGAKWLATYPASGLKAKMEYYIAPVEQSDDVKAKLKEITPTSLNPEELTVLDPACGSGHILVEAYDLLKEIYLERGYRAKDIPALILTKNLYGLEIDDRAAQLAGFAFMMKARQDDKEIFKKSIKPYIVCIKGANYPGSFKDAKDLIELFENAKTFGSLIRVPEEIVLKLSDIKRKVQEKRNDLNSHLLGEGVDYYDDILALVQQTELLSKRYDCVIANPPYMGGKFMNPELKKYLNEFYKESKADLFSAFINRNLEFVSEGNFSGYVTPFVWMFISTYEKFREQLLSRSTICSLIQLEYNAFEPACVPVCSFVLRQVTSNNYQGVFIKLSDFKGCDNQEPKTLEAIKNPVVNWRYLACTKDFRTIPGVSLAYWLSKEALNVYSKEPLLETIASPRQGLATTDNNRFLRYWHEISVGKISFECKNREQALSIKCKWFPYNKGGDYRRWYGNNEYIVNWEDDGKEIKENVIRKYPYLNGNPDFVTKNQNFYFKEGITWTYISNVYFGVRYSPPGFIFDVAGSSVFPNSVDLHGMLSLMSSIVSTYYIKAINPTMNIQAGNVGKLPVKYSFIQSNRIRLNGLATKAINYAKIDWDSFENSWDFTEVPLLRIKNKPDSLFDSYSRYQRQCQKMISDMKEIERENNRIFIEAYGLQDKLIVEVPIEEITLFANPKYRYKGELTNDELEARYKSDTIKELISYSVGCMMGRYSLDVSGLVYAHSENKGFDPKKYKTFPADEDGIIPITEREWFDDDAAPRFFRFIETAWDKKGLDENLEFIADAIGRKSGESSREAIRRYFSNDFFKDHVHTYKNRPIYWLFSSGKEKAFQSLIYLHRYNESTLSRMRTEYVLPLQTKISRQIEHLEKDKDTSQSGSAANKIQKEIFGLRKQAEELRKFDELLRHYADKKIKFDLDDGVKINYGKFGDLLSDVKKIAGSNDDEQREDTD